MLRHDCQFRKSAPWDYTDAALLYSPSSLATRPCVRASVRPCVRASVRPCVRASVRPCVRASVRPCVRASVRPCVRASVRPSFSCLHLFRRSLLFCLSLSILRSVIPLLINFFLLHLAYVFPFLIDYFTNSGLRQSLFYDDYNNDGAYNDDVDDDGILQSSIDRLQHPAVDTFTERHHSRASAPSSPSTLWRPSNCNVITRPIAGARASTRHVTTLIVRSGAVTEKKDKTITLP